MKNSKEITVKKVEKFDDNVGLLLRRTIRAIDKNRNDVNSTDSVLYVHNIFRKIVGESYYQFMGALDMFADDKHSTFKDKVKNDLAQDFNSNVRPKMKKALTRMLYTLPLSKEAEDELHQIWDEFTAQPMKIIESGELPKGLGKMQGIDRILMPGVSQN